MAKKIFWKDNTTPPTNHIWAKTDDNGKVIGIYEHDGDKWVLVKTPQTGGGVPTTNIPNQVYVTDKYGNQISIEYNVNPIPNTIAVRDAKGNLKTGIPIENNDCVPLELFSWIEV